MINNVWKGKNGPLLIAEIGGNHEGNFQYAKKLLRLAINCGVDVIKFQIYRGSSLVNKFISLDRYRHFQKFELSKKQHLYLADMCIEAGLKYMSSVWNKTDLKWIEKKMDIIKIGSGDLTAYDLINEICKYKKPLLLSTGLSNLDEIKNTLKLIKSQNKFYKNPNNISIMQCTSSYPTNTNEINLNVILTLKKLGYVTGYSHHGLTSFPLEVAYIMGSQVFEFHFTDTRKGKHFRDHKISLTPQKVNKFIKKIKLIDKIKGSENKGPTKNEILSDNITTFRRSLYLKKNFKKNHIIKDKDLISLRPNKGISASNYYKVINKKLLRNINKLEVFSFKDIK